MIEPFDAAGWWATNKPAEAPQQAGPVAPRGVAAKGANRIAKYAAGALQKACEEMAAEPPDGHNRNNRLNLVAVAMGELVAAGQLTQAQVEQDLTAAALQTGLDEHGIRGTLTSGLRFGMSQPRNLNELATTEKALPPGKPPVAGGLAKPGDDDDAPCRPGYEDNPHRLARAFLREKFTHEDGHTLRFWNEEFHIWTNGAYRPCMAKEARGMISSILEDEFERVYESQLLQMAKKEKSGDVRPIPVTTNIVGHVIQALSGITMLSSADYPEQPCWIDGKESWPIHEVMPMKNSIVHLPSYINKFPCTRKPTPQLFCGHALNYDFDPDAPQPTRWLEFLRQLWPNDPASISTLQEWMGLNLVPDTRHQKIMAYVGARRAGKGTIAFIQQALVGRQNCCGPTMNTFEDTFGLQDFIGKLSAIFDDVRITSRMDHGTIAERLLSISGEGFVTVRRMHRPGWSGKLSTRITMLSNSLPKIQDESGVLASRFIVLKFKNSFFGREDLGLKTALLRELPGILKWAIEGWGRLDARGRFEQPDSGMEELGSLRDLSSPITKFVEDCCDVGPDLSCSCSDAYRAWRAWCEEQGKKEPGDQTVFGRNLRSIVPELETKQIRASGGVKPRHFIGLALKPPGGQDAAPEQSPPGDFDFGDIPDVPY